MSAPAIRWFDDSPDAGEPDCVCSYCGERMEERNPELAEWEDDPSADPSGIRMWKNGPKGENSLEARFHDRCFNECIELGLVSLK